MKLLLIDGFNFIRRIYEAGQGAVDLAESAERAATSLRRALRQHEPTHAVCVMEHHDRTWRHLLYPEYKANRKPTPAPLLAGLREFETRFREAGVATIAVPNYEADDVIATLAVVTAAKGGTAIILASDKYYLQLLREGIVVYDHFQQLSKDEDYVSAKFGVAPQRLTTLWALAGDATNHIPGVAGIGPKTAQQLIRAHGSLADILGEEAPGKPYEALRDARRDIETYHRLVSLKQDVEVGVNLRELRLASGPSSGRGRDHQGNDTSGSSTERGPV